MNNDIKRLEEKIDEVFQKILEKQNSQFTDLMNEIRKLENSIARKGSDANEEDILDSLYEKAEQLVVATGQASTSFLQRKLGVGYVRATHLIDALEDKGVVGPAKAGKPRKILKENTHQAKINTMNIEDDDLYEEAKKIALKAGKVSVSILQRKLGIGFSRSSRLMEMLEEQGVVGPKDNTRIRKVVGA